MVGCQLIETIPINGLWAGSHSPIPLPLLLWPKASLKEIPRNTVDTRVAKTGHKGVDVKIPDNKDKENKPEECILVWRVTSRVILNLQFNESAKLPWISGSVFDPCTTWPLRCLECQNCLRLPDGLERRADQSENLMVLENLLKSCISAGSVPQYNLPCSHTQSTPEKVNTKCLGKV